MTDGMVAACRRVSCTMLMMAAKHCVTSLLSTSLRMSRQVTCNVLLLRAA